MSYRSADPCSTALPLFDSADPCSTALPRLAKVPLRVLKEDNAFSRVNKHPRGVCRNFVTLGANSNSTVPIVDDANLSSTNNAATCVKGQLWQIELDHAANNVGAVINNNNIRVLANAVSALATLSAVEDRGVNNSNVLAPTCAALCIVWNNTATWRITANFARIVNDLDTDAVRRQQRVPAVQLGADRVLPLVVNVHRDLAVVLCVWV